MFAQLKERLSYIKTDNIDYNEFYTFTYGKDWNEKIITSVDNDEALRIIFVCYALIETDTKSISMLWKKASDYVQKKFPYNNLEKLYQGMGIHLGLSAPKTLELYNKSEDFEDLNNLLDIFYKWVYNEQLNNVNIVDKPEPEKLEIKKPIKPKIIKKALIEETAVIAEKVTKSVKKPTKKVQTEETPVELFKEVEEAVLVKKPKKPTKK